MVVRRRHIARTITVHSLISPFFNQYYVSEAGSASVVSKKSPNLADPLDRAISVTLPVAERHADYRNVVLEQKLNKRTTNKKEDDVSESYAILRDR